MQIIHKLTSLFFTKQFKTILFKIKNIFILFFLFKKNLISKNIVQLAKEKAIWKTIRMIIRSDKRTTSEFEIKNQERFRNHFRKDSNQSNLKKKRISFFTFELQCHLLKLLYFGEVFQGENPRYTFQTIDIWNKNIIKIHFNLFKLFERFIIRFLLKNYQKQVFIWKLIQNQNILVIKINYWERFSNIKQLFGECSTICKDDLYLFQLTQHIKRILYIFSLFFQNLSKGASFENETEYLSPLDDLLLKYMFYLQEIFHFHFFFASIQLLLTELGKILSTEKQKIEKPKEITRVESSLLNSWLDNLTAQLKTPLFNIKQKIRMEKDILMFLLNLLILKKNSFVLVPKQDEKDRTIISCENKQDVC
ncbi:hypothetical protein M0811_05840 [Anaeramoeba ignava]|uniref:Uncharacterized protein n=1 Tax=Anaeramoeba ignava TaxID=1746090 RepID=A0A9Q0LTU3_ANAIG|nr:hypothetical protein M0811_05840 [Anaeramoeba ignava]